MKRRPPIIPQRDVPKLLAPPPPDMEQEVPAGKVRLKDGSIIDRADCVFFLQPHEKDAHILGAMDGTVYYRGKNGSLRVVRRVTKEERKAIKRAIAEQRKRKAVQ